MTHIEALEKIIQLQEQKIMKLELDLINEKAKPAPTPQLIGGGLLGIPSVTCQHEYPQLWNGIFLPPCRKCGHTQSNYYSVPNHQSFIGGGSIWQVQNQCIQGQQNNLQLVPEAERNRG